MKGGRGACTSRGAKVVSVMAIFHQQLSPPAPLTPQKDERFKGAGSGQSPQSFGTLGFERELGYFSQNTLMLSCSADVLE